MVENKWEKEKSGLRRITISYQNKAGKKQEIKMGQSQDERVIRSKLRSMNIHQNKSRH